MEHQKSAKLYEYGCKNLAKILYPDPFTVWIRIRHETYQMDPNKRKKKKKD